MLKKLVVYIFVLVILSASSGSAQNTRRIIRMGYFEGGPYYSHKVLNNAIKSELEQMAGDSLDFVFEPQGYRSAEWTRDICRSYGRDYTRMKDIDIVIAAGPWVVEDLLEAGYKGAVVGIGQFDPLDQGLIDASGRPIAENLTVNYHPGKIESDIETIQKLFAPRRIGCLYFPSADESAAVKSRLALAADRFDARIVSAEDSSPEGLFSFFLSFANIQDQCDVLYLPPMWGMELEQMQQFLSETILARVPTFTSEGYLILEKGATAANCVRPDLPLARFTAYKIMQIIHGAVPASLPTLINEAPAMCLNLESARKLNINFDRSNINNARTIPALPGEEAPKYTLAAAIDQAMRENVSMLGNKALYQKALAAAGKAYSAFYPDIRLNLEAAASNNESSAPIYNDILNREFSADVILDQKLFSYPAVKAVHVAQKKLQIEEANLRQAELDLKYAITTAYISVLENGEKVRTIEDKIDRLRQYWEMTLTNARIGHADTLDILILQERLVSAKMLLHDANSELRVSRVVLNVLLNRPGDEIVVLDGTDFAPEIMVAMARKFDDYTANIEKQKKFEDYLVRTGINNSTEMQVAALSVEIQRDLIAKNSRRYLPELTLRGKYSYSDEFEPEYGRNNDSWTIGGYLTLPLLSGSQWKHNQASLKAGMDERLYKKDMIRFERMETIIAAVEKLLAQVSTLPMSYFTKNLASDNLTASYNKFKVGQLTTLDLLAVEQYASSNELSLVERKYDFFISYAGMLNASGVGYLIHNSAEETEFYKNLESYLE